MTNGFRVAAAIALLCSTGLHAGDLDFRDRVDTLPLTSRLDCLGNLGGVTVDRLGFIYVANFRDAVWKISPEGQVETLTRSLYGASGNAIDSKGDLFQANFYGNTITRISRHGDVTEFASEGLAGPVGLAFDAGGNLFVCNCNGNSLSRVSPDGRVEPFAASPDFACPNGITFDDKQNLYVTNFNNHHVLRVDKQGQVERFATVPGGAGNAHITFSKGFFFITKIISNQVVKVSVAGEISPLAGTGSPGHQDGAAREATLFRPNGIAVSPQGDRLYVNTLVGEYSKAQPAEVTLRTITLVTLSRLLEQTLQSEGLEAASEVYRRFKADPERAGENTAGEVITFGYSLLSARQVTEALAVFKLNADSYPDLPAAQYHLGEAFRYIGQNEQAIQQYQKVLEIDPGHSQALSRLESLKMPQ